MTKIEFLPGKRYLYQQRPVVLEHTLDLHLVLGKYEDSGQLICIPIHELQPLPELVAEGETGHNHPKDDLFSISEKAWEKAQGKLAILQPLLADRGNRQLLLDTAQKHELSQATLYRWLKAYLESGSMCSLVELPHTGGKGRTRLSQAQDAIITQAIQTHYLTKQKKPITKVVLEIRQQCRQAGLKAPADGTVRRRIHKISEEEKVRRRWSNKMAKDKFDASRGAFPGAHFPLSVVQIDHTLVDLILVDEQYRQPLGRPWLTLAIDVFSRMAVGFYLSFDPPGDAGTGLCMAHAILPKETWLARMGVQADWPCWGVPSVLHADNAREFRGNMLQRACEKYGTRLEFRPVQEPHWGGHIERLMGTFMSEVHTLPGTTFSNVQERKEYNSAQKAVLTLGEFEQWLTTFIVNVYHKRIHQGIKTSPYERYREGIFGSPSQPGTGLPERLCDELQVRLDFMPGKERTVQQYGVVIGHIFYYADVLKPYVNSLEPSSGKGRLKRKFLFKRDPRDISCLYFLEPETLVYHIIPYRDSSRPAMSIWEFRQAKEQARQKGMEHVDEEAIFAAYDAMREVELAATERTRRVTKSSNRMLQGVPVSPTATLLRDNALAESSGSASDADTPSLTSKLPLTPFIGQYDDDDSFAS